MLGASASAAVATEASETATTLDPLQIAPQLRSLLRAVATLQTLGQGEPLALLPFDAQL